MKPQPMPAVSIEGSKREGFIFNIEGAQYLIDYPKNVGHFQAIVRAVNSHEALLSALKRMLVFSDSRIKDCSRSQAEASLADEVSDLIAQAEGK